MKLIPLSRRKNCKYPGLFATVDDEDFESVSQSKWSVQKSGVNFYAVRNIVKENGKKGMQLLHRFLLELTDPAIIADHKDNNGLNNCRENLRIADKIGNNRNRNRKFLNGANEFRGTSYNKNAGLFSAQIHQNNKKIHLGYFPTAELASEAYEKKAKELFGEFYNKPKETE